MHTSKLTIVVLAFLFAPPFGADKKIIVPPGTKPGQLQPRNPDRRHAVHLRSVRRAKTRLERFPVTSKPK
jgi:hypothetical protein